MLEPGFQAEAPGGDQPVHIKLDAAQKINHIFKGPVIQANVVIYRNTGKSLHRFYQEGDLAKGISVIDLIVPGPSRYLDQGIPGDGEQGCPLRKGVGLDQNDSIGPAGTLPEGTANPLTGINPVKEKGHRLFWWRPNRR